MPNPIISVFSDIPQSSETSAGSSAAQNTQRYKEIEQIAKYNRDNNTNFYTLAQIQEHQKKLQELERAKTVASNPDPEDVRDAYISALNPQTTKDVDKIRKWDKDAATTNAIGLTAVGTIPEMATFGVVPGLIRYGLGLITGHYGSQAGTAAGGWLDDKLGTKVFSPALGFIGGLAGYGMGADIATRIGRIPLWTTYEPLITNTPQLTGHFGQVKYYGPTMGKTTAAKSNPKLVDFDDIIRQPSRSILDRFGFKNKAEMYNSGNQEAIKAYEDMLVKSLRDWRANPENSNLILVASPTAIANPIKTGFYFDNAPSIPSRSVFIARNVGRGGTQEASAMWYDSLMEKNPNLKIDNRFVSEIETPQPISIVSTRKPWRTDPTKVNDAQRFYLQGQEGRGYFELVKDFEDGNYSVHFKPTDSTNPHAFSEAEKRALFQAVADAVPQGGRLSTWGSVSPGGVAGVNRFGNLGFTQTGTRPLTMKGTGEPINVPIFTKTSKNNYITPNTGYKSIFMEEPIMGRGRPKKSSTEVPVSPEAWDEMLFEDLIGEQGAINAARKASQAGKRVLNPITDAEKLGIPKSLRSDSRALEDPYYWGYKQWNQRYNKAVEAGNVEEAQRLRDLHFKIKAPNAPQYNFYHGTFNKERPFYIFEPQSNNELFFHFSPYKDTAEKFMGIAKNGRLITAKLNIQRPTTVTDSGWWNWYRIPEANPRISKKLGMNGPEAGQYYSDLLLKEPSASEANGKMMDMIDADALMYKNYTEDTGRISIAVPRPTQIKLSDPITRTKNGEIIPIVKRDNFHNLDIRYKQGGKINSIFKAQTGTFKDFWDSLPINQKDSTDFNVRRYWELWGKPKTFNEALEKGAYKLENDGTYHAFSGAWNENGEYEFTKSPQHSTVKNELDWFNSDDAKDFRSKYQLDSTSIPWKYKPINPQQ